MFYVITKKNITISIAIALLLVISLTFIWNYDFTPQVYLNQNNYTIVLDAGHGGIDQGVLGVYTKVPESELNLIIVKRLEEYFSNAGCKVVLTRKTSEGLYGEYSKGFKARDMAARKKIIEGANAECVISIHLNTYSSSQRRGIQAFFYDSGQSKSLAQSIQNVINTNLNEPFIGRPLIALYGDYYILKCTNAPSVIVECGFLSNSQDEKLLLDDNYRELLVYNLFTGIHSYMTNQ